MTDTSRTRYCSYCLTTFIGGLERCPNLGCRRPQPDAGWGILLEPGDSLDRFYRIQKRLAIGGAGVTYLAREIDATDTEIGPRLAIKVLYAQRDQGGFLRRLATEAQILQELDHPGIVQLMGFVHRKGHSPYLITRFEEGGSLLDHLRRRGSALDPKEAAAIGVQLCDALEVAHRRGVVHRDLKPENVLLKKIPGAGEYPRICLTDFGIAKVFGGVGGGLTQVGTFVGTPQYAAPEQFQGLEPTDATDIYAVGALLHFCLTLKAVVPFADQLAPEDTLELLEDKLPPWLELPDADPQAVGTLNSAMAAVMTLHPGDRSSLGRLRELLLAVLHDAPVQVSTSQTMIPTASDPGAVTPDPRSQDTFAGILSTTGPPKPGPPPYPAKAPTTWDNPGDPEADEEYAAMGEEVQDTELLERSPDTHDPSFGAIRTEDPTVAMDRPPDPAATRPPRADPAKIPSRIPSSITDPVPDPISAPRVTTPPPDPPVAPPVVPDPPIPDPPLPDPTPSLPDPPTPDPPTPAVKPPASLLKRAIQVAAALVFLGGGLFVAVIVALVVFVPKLIPDDLGDLLPDLSVPELPTPDPTAGVPRLDTSDPAQKADYFTIQMSMDEQLGAFDSCNYAVDGGSFTVSAVVEPGGAVSHASIDGVSSGARCVASAVESMTFKRNGSDQVLFVRTFEIE